MAALPKAHIYCKSFRDLPAWLQSKSIEAGDALWVAQPLQGGSIYALDTIIERKRIDDLAASIKDQRYERQKYFLVRCGILRTMYVLEGDIDLAFQVPRSATMPFPAPDSNESQLKSELIKGLVFQACSRLRQSLDLCIFCLALPLTLADDMLCIRVPWPRRARQQCTVWR